MPKYMEASTATGTVCRAHHPELPVYGASMQLLARSAINGVGVALFLVRNTPRPLLASFYIAIYPLLVNTLPVGIQVSAAVSLLASGSLHLQLLIMQVKRKSISDGPSVSESM